MEKKLTCFKAYDVRGELNVNFDHNICYRIGRAFGIALKAKTVVVGFDARESSPTLADSLIQGLNDEGVEVLDIGLSGTEEVYWATTEYNACGGIEVTASHNPINYNGLKMVKSGSKPLDIEKDMLPIRRLAEKNVFTKKKTIGLRKDIIIEAKERYARKIVSFLNVNPSTSRTKPLRIVVNSGNGAAGPTFRLIEAEISKKTQLLNFEHIFQNPDSKFPNGIPNPLLRENQSVTQNKVIEASADFGIAFDGDFDRCFFFDENGEFVSGEYIVGLFADFFLDYESKGNIVIDNRLIWNVEDIVLAKRGSLIKSKAGHTFIKKAMRENNAIYGGEISAHHYFRDFSFCDSGMIPWLLLVNLIIKTGRSLSYLIKQRRIMFPSSGEINFRLKNPELSISRVEKYYASKALKKTNIDGVSFLFSNWRFNLRRSNTEPIVRLNIESRADRKIIKDKIDEITALLQD